MEIIRARALIYDMQVIRRKKTYTAERNILSYQVSTKKPKKRGRFFIAVLVVLIAIIGSIIYAVFKVEFLKVNTFEISGNRLLDADEVKEVSIHRIEEHSRLASILGPEHVWFWSLSERNMDFSTPTELKSVVVNVDSVSRRVGLIAEERNVAHIVCKGTEGPCYGITGDGLVFAEIPTVQGSLILKIEDSAAEPVTVGSVYFANKEFLRRIYETTTILESHGFSPSLIRVRDHALNEWEVVLSSGTVMYFAGSFVPKELQLVLEEIKKKGGVTAYKYIDFRVEDKVFYQ